MSSLVLQNVSHSYNKDVATLKDVNLTINSGEIVCLWGSSGSGKSTLLNLIAGVYKLQGGNIFIDDKLIASDRFYTPIEKRHIALVLQEAALIPKKNALDNVAYCINAKNKFCCYWKAMHMLKMMGMQDLAMRLPEELSVGQQHRIALARSLAQDVNIILFDEPFASLDEFMKNHLRKEMFNLLRAKNMTVLFVTHHPDDALLLADRIYYIDRGIIRQKGSAVDLYKEPCSPSIMGLFGDFNKIYATVCAGKIDIDFGVFDVAYPDGVKILCCIRSDGLLIDGIGDILCKTVDVRFIGLNFIVYFKITGNQNKLNEENLSGDVYTIKTNLKLSVGDQFRISIKEHSIFFFECDE